MQHIAITAEPRPTHFPKSLRKSMRKSGRILASVYGKGQDSVSVILSPSDMARVLNSETGRNTLLDLTINANGQSTGKRQLARIATIEMEPLTNHFRHVGLHVIAANETQKATVPIEIVGEPEAVHNHEGIVESGISTVEIQAMPENLVGHLTLDISDMQIGDVKHASDLELPKNVQLLTDGQLPVASLRVARDIMSADERELNEDDETLTGLTRDASSPEEALQEV